MDQLKEDILCYKLNIGKHSETYGKQKEQQMLEGELLKMSSQNKMLKKEIVDLRLKIEELNFK